MKKNTKIISAWLVISLLILISSSFIYAVHVECNQESCNGDCDCKYATDMERTGVCSFKCKVAGYWIFCPNETDDCSVKEI